MHKLITAMEPQRDDSGYWTHPNYFEPVGGREFAAPGEFEAWQDNNRVIARVLWAECDVTGEQLEALEDSDGDISQWNPTPPDGNGWFIGSIHDTEDGPLCVWLCPVEGEPRALKDHINRCHVAALKTEFLNAHRVCLQAAHAYFCACDIGEDRTFAHEIYQRVRLATFRGGC
ncbi:hypothetical protein Z042_22910 [Chania multitudinisentens RB-25]|uniref:Uncharacterized protein n=1 Tax=Chania multitudinisentens RB-25 TaxID=1441930 RepID=W0LE78_9GAMM|nr:hypothetical protein [Chania multitudinisentens]AHG22158.1 hypothetical protein Z042_22910 [Chania multitudinisentens RB-25]